MASFHMDEDTLVSYQDAEAAGVFVNWEKFVKSSTNQIFIIAYDEPMKAQEVE